MSNETDRIEIFDGTDWGTLKGDINKNLSVTLGTALVEGTDSISNYPPRSSFYNAANNTAAVIKASAGFLLGIIVNTAGTTSTLTVYNDPAAANNKFGAFSTIAQNYIPVNAYLSNGIYIVPAGAAAADFTLVYI